MKSSFFVAYHEHEDINGDASKEFFTFLGVFSTTEKAVEATKLLVEKGYFEPIYERFVIAEMNMDEIAWEDGFFIY